MTPPLVTPTETRRDGRRIGFRPGPVAVLGLLAALFMAGLVAPAQAATSWASGPCARGTGVTVVVEWGASATVRCAPRAGGQLARAAFAQAGHVLEDVRRTPGFVCRIDARPGPAEEACVVTPPAERYWSLWHSPGRDGRWTYAQLGVDNLRLPAGSWVAFDFHRGSGRASAPSTALPSADKRLSVGVRYATVKPRAYQRVTARGLARGEKATVTYRGKVVARVRASTSGTLSQRFRTDTRRGSVAVTVTGEHVGRVGSTTFRIR